jgi:aspartate racemase
MGPTLEAWERGDMPGVMETLGRTAQRLASAGCDFFVCPDNTAHIALESATLPIPGLHIADVVAARAKKDGRRRVGLLTLAIIELEAARWGA